ncbi:MAG: undecaprenyldiphospho-muramoylpentapeptide beta-N-acetylglucosaminyltransferase [Patescibacteria group bacterium]
MKIALAGGGTGGHIVPLINVANKIREKFPDAEFVFIGSKGKMEEEFMSREGIPTENISVGKMRRYFAFANFIDFFKVIAGVFHALWYLLVHMPDAIFSKGGYASFPVVLVGWLYRIPIMIHESDSVPGVTNSILSKFATRIAVSYPSAEKEFPASQVVLTGNPLQPDINQGDAARIRAKFSLLESKRTIFVMGGSQGSRIINIKIVNILPQLLHKYQVIHQTGEKNFEEVKHKAGELGIKAGREGYHIFPFIGAELKDVFAVADLVITRAGANSLSEVAANAKPSIVIPIESSANNHQRMNAYALAKIGGCVVLEETNLGEHVLLNKINEIMESAELQKKLSENIKTFYHADAAEKITEGILGMMEK